MIVFLSPFWANRTNIFKFANHYLHLSINKNLLTYSFESLYKITIRKFILPKKVRVVRRMHTFTLLNVLCSLNRSIKSNPHGCFRAIKVSSRPNEPRVRWNLYQNKTSPTLGLVLTPKQIDICIMLAGGRCMRSNYKQYDTVGI